jgi:hypothetical protein
MKYWTGPEVSTSRVVRIDVPNEIVRAVIVNGKTHVRRQRPTTGRTKEARSGAATIKRGIVD